MHESVKRCVAAAVGACLMAGALVGCGHASGGGRASGAAHPTGGGSVAGGAADAGGTDMNGMDMKGMDMGGTGGSGDDMPGMGVPSGPKVAAAVPADNGLHGSVGGYAYVADKATLSADTAAPFTFHITGPSGKTITRFQPYEGQLLVFYLARTDLSGFHRLTASMRDDGTWIVRFPALAAGSYRTYITFAAPDSAEGTPLSYSLSQPLTVPGNAIAATVPAASATATVDGYTLNLTGSPHQGSDAELGVVVTRNGKPVQQFDRLLDGYAHFTAVHGGDAAFVRALSTGRAAGGAGGAGALTARIRFPEAGTWRLFVQFETSGVEHTASFTVEVP